MGPPRARSGGVLVRGSWKSITVCLSVCTSVYVVTNLVLVNRSTEIERRRRAATGHPPPATAIDEEEKGRSLDDGADGGWWLPQPPGHVAVGLRHLLGGDDDGPPGAAGKANASRLRRLVPAQLHRVLELSSRCDRVAKVENLTYLTSGWTKAVYRGRFENRDVAVKMADRGGYDVRRCVKTTDMTSVQCQRRAEDKILKEGFILMTLDNPHIVRLLDVCVTSSETGSQVHSGPLVVTELGEIVDIIKLLQMSWEDRLRLSFGLSKLLRYLASTRYGSVVVNDFRRQQFIIIDGELKLIDVDDVGFDELICSSDRDCQTQLPASNITVSVPCSSSSSSSSSSSFSSSSSGRCVGLNEMKNTLNAGRHFVGLLLPHGAPFRLRPLVDRIVDAYATAALTARELTDLMTNLVHLYSKGFYLQRPSSEPVYTTYKKIDDSDLPGLFDYRCRYSIATSGCTVSAFDEKEAEDLCDFDSQCRAFVISSEKTWTGRLIAHLKNNISSPTPRHGMRLYVRQWS